MIELDLEKFFDKVNHDKLMGSACEADSRQANAKTDTQLSHQRHYGRGHSKSPNSEGTPQGSPLSPLLSNIVLHELDKELSSRGHRYVRYADDCSIYVRSEKSAQRVMETITGVYRNQAKIKGEPDEEQSKLPP